MKRLGLKLVCEPINPEDKQLYTKWFEVGFGSIVPLDWHGIPEDKFDSYYQVIAEYLQVNQPHFTSLRFTDMEGGEPAYIDVTSTLQRQDEDVWNHVFRLWPRLINRLIGVNNICYFYSMLHFHSEFTPEMFDGKIIETTEQGVVKLFECTESFLELASHDPLNFLSKSNVWFVNSPNGYVLRKKDEHRLKEWFAVSEVNTEIVGDFFETAICSFQVMNHGAGMCIVSHTLDWKAISDIVEVDKVNEELQKVNT